MKYAFTFKPHREIVEFVGPFDSYKKMVKAIVSLANDDDTGTDQVIENSLFIDHDLEYLNGNLNICVYEVAEQPFNDKDFMEVCDSWREEIEKKNKRFKNLYAKNEREQYERLKKKFEG